MESFDNVLLHARQLVELYFILKTRSLQWRVSFFWRNNTRYRLGSYTVDTHEKSCQVLISDCVLTTDMYHRYCADDIPVSGTPPIEDYCTDMT